MRRPLTQYVGRIEVLGLVLLGLMCILNWLSRCFIYGQGHLARPIVWVVCVLLCAFLVYGIAVAQVLRRPTVVTLGSVVLFAVLFRLVLIPSHPIQEDDSYRYVWDGQVSLQGISPYRYAPAAVATFDPTRVPVSHNDRAALVRLHQLADTNHILGRVNHPQVRTVYPPVAQAVFAVIQRVAPWSLRGVRSLLLCFDLLCIALLVALLMQLQLHPSRVLIYAWSPLVIKEFANSGHMDTIAIAAVLLTILLLLRRQWIGSCISLALGVASKVYPLILVPVVGQWLWRTEKHRAAWSLLAFIGVLAVCVAPMWSYGSQSVEGLVTYAKVWQLNAGIFGFLEWVIGLVAGSSAPSITRGVVGGLMLAAILWALRWRHASVDPLIFTQRCFIVLGACFLLSPVQDPWYLAWVIPLLCIHPSRAWLLLTGLIQLYYLGFFVEYHYPAATAQRLWNLIKCVEYLPFYGCLLYSLWRWYYRPTSR